MDANALTDDMAASHKVMEEGGQAQSPKPSSRGLMSEVWSTQAWKLLPLVFIYVACKFPTS